MPKQLYDLATRGTNRFQIDPDLAEQLNEQNKNGAEAYTKIAILCPHVRANKHCHIAEIDTGLITNIKKVVNKYCPVIQKQTHEAIHAKITMSEFYDILITYKQRLHKEAENVAAFSNKVRRKAFKAFLTDPFNARTRIFGALSAPKAPPLIFLYQNNTTLITPDQPDEAYDETRGDIIAGGAPFRRKWIGILFEKIYEKQLVNIPPADIPPIEAQQLQFGIKCSSVVGASLDNISPPDHKYMPFSQIQSFAKIFNKIEEHAIWRTQTLIARAVFLHKPDANANDMAGYRILLITSEQYRLWSRTRSRQLDGWAAQWVPSGSYVAGPEAGALDAHYQLVLRVEVDLQAKCPFAGGSTDLSKCFDRMIREIIQPIALKQVFQKTSWIRTYHT